MDALSKTELGDVLAKACATGRTDLVKQALAVPMKLTLETMLDAKYPGNLGKRDADAGAKDSIQLEDASTLSKAAGAAVKCTALHISCAHGQVDCVRALLGQGAATDLMDSLGLLPLQVVPPAHEKGAAVRSAFQQELLQRVASGNVQGVKELLRGGVDPNKGDGSESDGSALHWAAAFGQRSDMVETLVNAGAKLERQNSKGQTPLHEACEAGHASSAQALVQVGADANAQDHSKSTPADIIKANADSSVREELARALESVATLDSKQGLAQERDCEPAFKNKDSLVDSLDSSGFKKVPDHDEVVELRRMNEEKDMMLVAMRETVETLLDKDGVLKYISKLQEEYRTLSAQLQRVEDHKDHLQSMYLKCDSELDQVLKENAALRQTVSEKEEQILGLLGDDEHRQDLDELDEAVAAKPDERGKADSPAAEKSGSPTPEDNSAEVTLPRKGNISPATRSTSACSMASASSRGLGTRQDSVDLIILERDRLAREVESERRLRFSEARLHLGYTGQLREQLKALQAQVTMLSAENQNRDTKGMQEPHEKGADGLADSNVDPAPRGMLSSLFNALFGAEDDEEFSDYDYASGDEGNEL